MARRTTPTEEELQEWETAGKWLRAMRQSRNLSQKALAQKVGTSLGSICTYENALRPVPEKLRPKICKALNCRQEDIWQ